MQGVEAELFPDLVFTDEHVRDVRRKLRNVDGLDQTMGDLLDDPGVILLKKVSTDGAAGRMPSRHRPR